jgi:hypothetical protein
MVAAYGTFHESQVDIVRYPFGVNQGTVNHITLTGQIDEPLVDIEE